MTTNQKLSPPSGFSMKTYRGWREFVPMPFPYDCIAKDEGQHAYTSDDAGWTTIEQVQADEQRRMEQAQSQHENRR